VDINQAYAAFYNLVLVILLGIAFIGLPKIIQRPAKRKR